VKRTRDDAVFSRNKPDESLLSDLAAGLTQTEIAAKRGVWLDSVSRAVRFQRKIFGARTNEHLIALYTAGKSDEVARVRTIRWIAPLPKK
jgi:hypothetical protein